jgi:hypothetical protein
MALFFMENGTMRLETRAFWPLGLRVQADTPLPNPEWYHRLDEQDISLDIIGDSAQVEFRVHARVGSLKVWRQGLCQRANHCVFLSTWPVYALFFSWLISKRTRVRHHGTLSVVTQQWQ